MHCTMPMPVMTTRLSWGSKVSSCDAICSVARRGPRAPGVWSCLDVGTKAMTPAAAQICRNIRPMVNECLQPSLVARLGLHDMDLFGAAARSST